MPGAPWRRGNLRGSKLYFRPLTINASAGKLVSRRQSISARRRRRLALPLAAEQAPNEPFSRAATPTFQSATARTGQKRWLLRSQNAADAQSHFHRLRLSGFQPARREQQNGMDLGHRDPLRAGSTARSITSLTAEKNGFASSAPQTAKATNPSWRTHTQRFAESAAGSGKNIADNWPTATSNVLSANGQIIGGTLSELDVCQTPRLAASA